jgi:hypothetical protein
VSNPQVFRREWDYLSWFYIPGAARAVVAGANTSRAAIPAIRPAIRAIITRAMIFMIFFSFAPFLCFLTCLCFSYLVVQYSTTTASLPPTHLTEFTVIPLLRWAVKPVPHCMVYTSPIAGLYALMTDIPPLTM